MRSSSDPTCVVAATVGCRLAACGSGQSILEAGNDARHADDGAAQRTSRRRHAGHDRVSRSRRRTAGRVDDAAAADHDRAVPADDDVDPGRPTVDSRRARSTRSTAPPGRSRSRSGTGCSRAPRRRCTQLTDEYNASQDRVRVELQNQTATSEIDRQVLPVEPGRAGPT